MRRLLILWLLSVGIAWGCIAFERRDYYSSNKSWHYQVFWDSGFRHELLYRNKVIWSRHLDSLPGAGAVSDNGRWTAFQEGGGLKAVDQKGQVSSIWPEPDPRVLYDSFLSLWFEGDRLWLESNRGLLFHCLLPHGQMQEASPQEALALGLQPAKALGVAIKHRLDLPEKLLKQAAALRDEETREMLAAYRVLRGDPGARKILQGKTRWRPLLEGPSVRLNSSSWNDSGGLMLFKGVLDPHEALFIKHLEQGHPEAAMVLASIGGPRSVPPLLRSLKQGNSETALPAIVSILGSEASSQLLGLLPAEESVQDRILSYFARVEFAPAIPVLLKLPWSPEVRRALTQQIRQDLGDDPKLWRQWWQENGGRQRWTSSLNPDLPLWQGRRGQDPGPGLMGSPRLVQLLPAAGAQRIGLTNRHLRLLKGRQAQSARGWHWWSGRLSETFPLPLDDRRDWASSQDGRVLVISDDQGVRRIEPTGKTVLRKASTWFLELSPSGHFLQLDNVLIDLASGQQRSTGWMQPSGASAFDPQERFLWSKTPLALAPGPKLPASKEGYRAHSPALSPDGTRWVDKGLLYLLESQKVVKIPEGEVRWCCDNSCFLLKKDYLSDHHGGLELRDRDGKKVHSWPEGGATRFSPDGRLLAVQAGEKVQIWNRVTLEQVAQLPARHWIEDMAFTPDGDFLAILADNCVNIWQIKGQQRLALEPDIGSQLWTGRRLQGGTSRWLRPEEYARLRQQWLEQTGWNWSGISPEAPASASSQALPLAAAGCLLLSAWVWTAWRRASRG